jgi:hypothetical protein
MLNYRWDLKIFKNRWYFGMRIGAGIWLFGGHFIAANPLSARSSSAVQC